MKILKKIEPYFLFCWVILLPSLIAILIILGCCLGFTLYDIELATTYLNTGCLIAIIYLSVWFIFCIYGLVSNIAEKIHFYKIDKYEKSHPEETKQKYEDMAKHFEELAQKIRENEKNE